MKNIKTIQLPDAVTLICDKLLQRPNRLILLGLSSHHQMMIVRKEIIERLQENEIHVNRNDRIVAKNESCVLIKIATEMFGRGCTLDMLMIDKNIPELEACLYATMPTLRSTDDVYLLED